MKESKTNIVKNEQLCFAWKEHLVHQVHILTLINTHTNIVIKLLALPLKFVSEVSWMGITGIYQKSTLCSSQQVKVENNVVRYYIVSMKSTIFMGNLLADYFYMEIQDCIRGSAEECVEILRVSNTITSTGSNNTSY